MARMSREQLNKFLSKIRYGILTTLTSTGSPRSVPIWYDWDGEAVRIFTSVASPKVERIKQDPRISVLVANERDEPESWVAFDGQATTKLHGGIELAQTLTDRYWDMSNPQHQAILASWQAEADGFCVIELVPDRIRSYV